MVVSRYLSEVRLSDPCQCRPLAWWPAVLVTMIVVLGLMSGCRSAIPEGHRSVPRPPAMPGTPIPSPSGAEGPFVAIDRDVAECVQCGEWSLLTQAAEQRRYKQLLAGRAGGTSLTVDEEFETAARCQRWDSALKRRQELAARESEWLYSYAGYIRAISACDAELYEAALAEDWWRLLRLAGQWLRRAPDDVLAAWLAREAYYRTGRKTISVSMALDVLDFDEFEDCNQMRLWAEPIRYFGAKCVLYRPTSATAWALYADALLEMCDPVLDEDVAAIHAACHALELTPDDAIHHRLLDSAMVVRTQDGFVTSQLKHASTPYHVSG